MDEKKYPKFRARLLEYKKSLQDMSQAAEEAAETVELDQTRQGRLSRMDALQGQAMSIASLNRRNLELGKIDQALERLDNEDYGYCLECGEEISEQRLDFNPTVTHCIHCAEKLETEE